MFLTEPIIDEKETAACSMLKDFNLLVTTWRGNENNARSELKRLLEAIGESSPSVDKTGVSGLIVAKTISDPFEVINQFRNILHERPYEFRHALRLIPIEKVVHTDLDQIKEAVTQLSSRIGENETFRVTVEKRFTVVHTRDIIEAATANIKRKVNLKTPDFILLIEVIGGFTGLSLTKPNDTISVLKEKML
jgi:tRNA acetyltransferase TAN1